MKYFFLRIGDEEVKEIYIYVAIAIGAIIVYYFLAQWVFQIQKRNRYMEAQIKLLSKIAEKQGVSAEDIKAINEVAKG